MMVLQLSSRAGLIFTYQYIFIKHYDILTVSSWPRGVPPPPPLCRQPLPLLLKVGGGVAAKSTWNTSSDYFNMSTTTGLIIVFPEHQGPFRQDLATSTQPTFDWRRSCLAREVMRPIAKSELPLTRLSRSRALRLQTCGTKKKAAGGGKKGREKAAKSSGIRTNFSLEHILTPVQQYSAKLYCTAV